MYSSSYPQTSYPQSYPSVSREDKLGKKLLTDPLLNAVRWLKRRNSKEKLILGGVAALVVRTPSPELPEDAQLLARQRRRRLIGFPTSLGALAGSLPDVAGDRGP